MTMNRFIAFMSYHARNYNARVGIMAMCHRPKCMEECK